MILDHALVAPGDENKMFDPGVARLIHHILYERAVDDRQHFLGQRLGGGQEARAESGDGEDGLANLLHGSLAIGRCASMYRPEPIGNCAALDPVCGFDKVRPAGRGFLTAQSRRRA
jgi:hypothetical protein